MLTLYGRKAMKYIHLILFFCLFSACTGDKGTSIPDDVLPKEQMAKVMVDVHLLEASMNLNAYNPQMAVIANNVIEFDVDVLKKNNISREQYNKSFEFYSRNPRLLAEVYDLVMNELSRMQAEAANGK